MDVVSRHLSSNFPPSKTDVSSIKHSIILNDRKLLKIQQEIDEHHAELLKLRQRSNELQIRKQSYQGILSPIRRLPISILSEIFRVTINASMSDDPWLNLKLMGVCQLWRNTFLNTPVLWTALVLPKSIPTEKVRDVVQGAMQYIRRSRALPLSISLDALQVSRQDAADLFSCILAKQRWKDVTLSGAFVEFFLAATKPLENSPFKVLRSLKIRESPTYQTNYLRGNYSLQLTDLPMLSSLSLETASHVNIAALYVPFSQLKCLSLTALSNTGDYLEILRACPNLEECSFAIHPCGKLYCGTLINTENPPPNVFCPNLRRLTLGSAEYLISLLLFMMAPRLEDFTLSSTFQQLEEDTIAVDMGLDQELLFFLNASRCMLRRLELDGVPVARNDFVPLVETMSSLEELKLRTSQFHMRNYFDGTTVQRMKNWRSVVLPKLQVLEVSVPTGAVTRCDFQEYACLHGKIKKAKLKYLNEDIEDEDAGLRWYLESSKRQIDVHLPPDRATD